MRENVLLLCLSKVDFSHGLTRYTYDAPEVDGPIEGYMTNEAPVKVTLSLVNLDRIVIICSEDVLEDEIPKIDTSEEEDKIRRYIMDDNEFPISNMEQFEKYIGMKYSHLEYYKAVVTKYAMEKGRKIPEFYPVEISNNPTEYEIAEAAVKAANLVMGIKNNEGNNEKESNCERQLNAEVQKRDLHLYIDYNGGQRYIASMLLNTANLIEQRGANIEKIFTMNFLNKDNNGYVAVENFMGVLQSSRLVSGIKEYDDYGRCKELQKYFSNYDDNDIQEILEKMENISHYFQMCDTVNIFGTEKTELKRLLDNYVSKDDAELEKRGARSILFKYVAEDILEGYQPLFNDDLLNFIDWCCEKDYIQQAVTFYAERMPVYFWDNGIYYPTEEEEAEYQQINKACTSIKQYKRTNEYRRAKRATRDSLELHYLNDFREFNKMKSDDLTYLQREYLNYDWKYAWMTKYLRYSGKDKFDWMENSVLRNQQVKYWENSSFWCQKRVRSKYVPNKGEKNPRKQKNKLHNILNNYKEMKQQRNTINHADSAENNFQQSERWDYARLVEQLKKDVNEIREFMNVDNYF